jgi:hypothetical protein
MADHCPKTSQLGDRTLRDQSATAVLRGNADTGRRPQLLDCGFKTVVLTIRIRAMMTPRRGHWLLGDRFQALAIRQLWPACRASKVAAKWIALSTGKALR